MIVQTAVISSSPAMKIASDEDRVGDALDAIRARDAARA
jgi:hypothetical protein